MTLAEEATASPTLVVKIGGATLLDAPQMNAIAGDLLTLRERGYHLVVVHHHDSGRRHAITPFDQTPLRLGEAV